MNGMSSVHGTGNLAASRSCPTSADLATESQVSAEEVILHSSPASLKTDYLKKASTPAPSTLGAFFDEKAMKIRIRTNSPSAREGTPNGGLRVHLLSDPGGSSMIFDKGEEAGKTRHSYETHFGIAMFPFERWTRVDGGWLAESVYHSPDLASPVQSALLSTFVSEEGKMRMALMEFDTTGGGRLYELHGASYQEKPEQAPGVQQAITFSPGERDLKPPFSLHTSFGSREIRSHQQFFNQYSPFFTLTPPDRAMNVNSPASLLLDGDAPFWHVKINRPLDGSDLGLDLRYSIPTGTVEETTRLSSTPLKFNRWERIRGGWKNVQQGKPVPENADSVKNCALKTLLKDNGTFSMAVHEEYFDGRTVVTTLNSDDFLKSPGKPPSVLSVKEYGKGEPLDDEKGMDEYVPAPATGEPEGETLVDEGEWLIIDGIKLEKNEKGL